jgi:hypothetical protein
MGVDVADFENSGKPSIAITNFDNEMIALYRPGPDGIYTDVALATGVGQSSRTRLGFGCGFADIDLDGWLDLLAVNGHIDDTVRNIAGNVGYAQPPHLFLNDGRGRFRDVAQQAGPEFSSPKVGRGLAFGDFDNDGDVDILLTTNQGSAALYRNDVLNGNRSLRIHLVGTKSNRDGIGAVVRAITSMGTQSRMVRSGSSYLSQSELPVTFGLGKAGAIKRLVIEWPSGTVDDFNNVRPGRYECTETRGIKEL